MFTVIKLGSLMAMGVVVFSLDPVIGGAFTILNTFLVIRLNRRTEERTDTIVSHIEELRQKVVRSSDAA